MASETLVLSADTNGLQQAANALRQGQCVAFPTETVYGLGADATNDAAVARIFAAKERPNFNPLIVHVPDLDSANTFVEISDSAREIAIAFWPGPLTLVLPKRAHSKISPLVSAGLDSLAIRIPAAPLAVALLRTFGGPLAAPSANPSGRISPTTAQHVLEGLTGRIAAVLDGGPCSVGVESTILDLTGPPRLLRPGGISREALEDRLGVALSAPAPVNDTRPNAPGQLSSHYAPKAPVRLNVTTPVPDETLLGFGPVEGATLNLSPSQNLTEATANLFGALHKLDEMKVAAIAVSPIPEVGLGAAINDRLRRAAAPRG